MNIGGKALLASCMAVAGVLSISTVQAAPARVCFESWKAGYIKAVSVNEPRFGNNHHYIGIEVYYPNAVGGPQTKHYISLGWGTVLDDQGKALLQLANSAFLSQTKVYVFLNSDNQCEEWPVMSPWIPHWRGLRLTDKPTD